MITIPTSTPRPISPAVTRKSPPPAAAGWADALAAGDGLATATADRVGGALGVREGEPLVGATLGGADGVGERGGVALAAPVGVAAAVGCGVGGDVAPPLIPSDAQARESLTPGDDPQTDRAGATHALPSAAVRESATRMKG